MNSIILPVLNEPELPNFIASLVPSLKQLTDSYEIIVITGDRETRNTIVPNFDDVKHYISYGDSLERAILMGFTTACGDKLLVMDADGSHPVDKIPEMITYLDSFDMVVGSRFVPGSVFHQTSFRRLVSHFFISMAHIAGSKLSDPMSGFFGFNRSILDGVRFKPVTWKTCLELELKAKPSLKEIPIKFSKRQAGVSKTSFKIGLKLLRDLI